MCDRNSTCILPTETGSLDRAKSAIERRKKVTEDVVISSSSSAVVAGTGAATSGRVEVTRVNPDSLIDELLRSTNLTHQDESAEGKYHL